MSRSAEQIFHEARRRTAGEARCAYLDGACGTDVGLRAKVDALLEADVEPGTSSQGAEADPDATLPPGEHRPGAGHAGTSRSTPTEKSGQTIGRYKLLQQIGEGGFGSVWMADQREPMKRRVALKIIKLGMDTKQVIARFDAERQALAMMDHPNIAKVLDAGSTDTGRPYFVMEYIRGVPILEYCDTEKLETQGRLELTISVCQAIQHAHQKGIIHRDIKPSNVLITMHDGKPVPKVIDFGIAKATNTELTQKTLFTEHRQMIGTPAYMSPEQAEMSGLDIDTRSDIYSLGVLLYELLTGTTPFDAKEMMSKGFAEMMRIIREVEPHKPSTRLSTLGDTATRTALQRHVSDPKKLRTILRGDLDWIVMKCLEKDRTRRYETANGLAADIQRHLNDEPVVAGRPGATYRLRKMIRRNRTAFAAGVVVSMALLGGILATTYGFVRARKAERVASVERDAAELARLSAEQERDRADRQSEVLRRKLYASQVRGIGAAIDDSNYRGMRKRLASCPQDLRNWEWQHLAWRLADRSTRTLSLADEDNGRARDVVLSGDGTRLLVAGGESLNIWNLSTGRVVQSLSSQDHKAYAIDWSDDGRYVLSAGPKRVRLWEMVTGRDVRQWTLPSSPGDPIIALSDDGASVVVGRQGSPCHLFDVTAADPVAELPHCAGAVVFSPDGQKIAYSSDRYGVALLDIRRGRVHEFPLQTRWIWAVAISTDGKWIVSGGGDKTVKIWDIAGGDARMTFIGHQDTVHSVAISADGKRIASTGADQTVRLWDSATGEPLAVLLGHKTSVRHVFFTPDGDQLVSEDFAGTVKVWPTTGDTAVLAIDAHTGDMSHALCVAFRQDGRQLASSGDDQLIRLWDSDSGRLIRTFFGHKAWIYSLAYRPPHGRLLASGDDNGTIHSWDTHTGKLLGTIHQTADAVKWDYVRALAFSPDGSRLVSASEDNGTVRVWDPDTGRELVRVDHPGARGCVFSPDGNWIADAGLDGKLKLRDATTGKEVRTFSTPYGLTCVAFSPDGAQVAASGLDGILRVWVTATGTEALTVNNFGGEVTSVVFSPDGQRIFCGLRDNTVRVWSATGEELLALRGHRNTVRSLAISPDGNTLASSSSDGTIRLWETGPPPSGYGVRRVVSTASSLAAQLTEDHEWVFKAIDAVESDQTLDPEVRDETLRMLYSQFGRMNEKSWSIARSPEKSAAEYRLAIRESQAALRGDPDNATVISTLGVAQYRAGQYPDALETLNRSMALKKPNSIRGVPEDLAFLAMTHHRLGDDKAAQKMLARLRSLLQEPRFRRNGEAVGFLREAEALIEINNEPAVTAVSPVPAPLREAYNLDPFYEKYLDVGGVPILASREVTDDALLVARSIVRYMMSGHPELYEPLRQHKIRIAIIGVNQVTTDIPEYRDLDTANPETDWDRRARGLGATKERPVCSAGEENLLALEGDRYRGENILVHEFAHTMADMAVQELDSEFVKKLEAAYTQAITNGQWRDTYAATNSSEYWAEGVQSWFDTNLESSKPDGIHNHVNTRDELRVYDAALAALIAEWLPDDDRRLPYPGS